MRRALWLVLMVLAAPQGTRYPSAEEIIKKIDQNIASKNRISISEMIIHGRRGTRRVRAKSWVQGTKKSFTVYLAPARDKGTKMLKIGDRLWTYSPTTDRVIQISGHMLRQSVMGSDLSYEDFMEDSRLREVYEATVIAEDTIAGRKCWVMQLTAKQPDVAYHSRKIWVDQLRFLALREERYAKSGKLLKTFEIKEMFQIDHRWYPKRMIFKDVLKRGKGTELIINSIEFNADIPPYLFTKASLRR